MSNTLPRLRMDLDFMPSPVEDRPGLLIRDPFQYSPATLIVPPLLVQVLELYDGENTELDLKQALVRLTGELDVSDLQEHLSTSLSAAGFLDDEKFAGLRAARHLEFQQSPVREPAHAGSAYPGESEELREVMNSYLTGSPATRPRNVAAIAAPHVSPFGGWEAYRAAYAMLSPEDGERTFVVLGTSHYGQPDRFGLTRKSFETPYGNTSVALGLAGELERAAPGAVLMEDFCHAVEHSIEFQVVFLQTLYGPNVKVLPILCGPFAKSILEGGMPEDNEDVKRFLGALSEINAREGKNLCWILGVDMAHIGVRYGDRTPVRANEDLMLGIESRDKQRIDCMNRSDAPAFWDLVQQNQDDLKWCGSSPIYTFLRAVPGLYGRLNRYQQWNIDEQSVVSFAGMTFTSEPQPTQELRPSSNLVLS